MHGFESDKDVFAVQVLRCVDGELSESEEQRFLIECDETTGGWKQLALTFIESRLIGEVCREVNSDAQSSSVVDSPIRGHRTLLKMMATACAVGLCAFFLGRLSATQVDPQESVIAKTDSQEAVEDLSMGTDPTHSPNSSGPRPVMFMTVKDPSGDGTELMRLPVYRRGDLPKSWRPHAESAITPEVHRHFAQAGINVASEKKMYAIAGPGNRPIWMPVESIKLTPARF